MWVNSADSRDSLNHRSLAINGDCSSAGRALDCDSGGRGFEPRQSPHFLGSIPGTEMMPLFRFLQTSSRFHPRWKTYN